MKLKRYAEPAKTVLIFLLTVSAVLLLWQSGVFRQLRGALTAASASDSSGESGISRNTEAAALPLTLSVNLADGSHYGVKYDAETLEAVFDRFSGALSEALGSSQTPVAGSVQGWERALTSPGLFLDFFWPVPLDSLAQWLGTEILTEAGDRQITRLCLAVEGQTVVLWFPGPDGFWCCQTALEPGDLLAFVGNCTANGAAFAWELDGDMTGDRWALVLDELPPLFHTESAVPSASQLAPETLLDAFGMNRFVATAYQEQGTRVFVEGGASLRLDGELSGRGPGYSVRQPQRGGYCGLGGGIRSRFGPLRSGKAPAQRHGADGERLAGEL